MEAGMVLALIRTLICIIDAAVISVLGVGFGGLGVIGEEGGRVQKFVELDE